MEVETGRLPALPWPCPGMSYEDLRRYVVFERAVDELERETGRRFDAVQRVAIRRVLERLDEVVREPGRT